MNKKRFCLILIGCLAMPIAGTLAVRLFYAAPTEQIGTIVKERETNNAPQQSEQHIQASLTNVLEGLNRNVEVGGFFETITDQQSGHYAIVSSNKSIVTLRDKNGKVIWLADVVGAIPIQELKYWGHEITFVKFTNDELLVWVSKSGFSLDKRTGKITSLGSD